MRAVLLLSRRSYRHSRLLQIATLVLIAFGGQALSAALGLPVPGGVVGLALVLALLASGLLRVGAVRRGANWLLAEMLLFFVPAVMSLLDHGEFVGMLGLKLLAVIVAGSVCVMVGTALAIDLCYRWMHRHEA